MHMPAPASQAPAHCALEVQPDEVDALAELPVEAVDELPELPREDADVPSELPREDAELPLEEEVPELPREDAPESVSSPRFWVSPQPSIGAALVSARVTGSQRK